MKKTFHTGRAALGALLEVSLALVPALLFFYTYIHHYPSATFWGRGNLLFFAVYFAILVLFMTIYGSFSIRKYRTRELVFAPASSGTAAITLPMCRCALRAGPTGSALARLRIQRP